MKSVFKRGLALVLVAVLVLSAMPVAFADSPETGWQSRRDELLAQTAKTAPDEQAYTAADAVFDALKELKAPAKKNTTDSDLTAAAIALVTASESYREGSLVRNGDAFTWWTKDGIRCAYNPQMEQIKEEMQAPEEPLADGAYNVPKATKNGFPTGSEVYLIGPYYGYDDAFTDRHMKNAEAIAQAIGDRDGYTLYSGTAATVDTVAEALSKGAVVIFDSHGMTDYAQGDDSVSGATSSYLCLTSTEGLTTEDYDDGAVYQSDGIWINGETIANHMTSDSPSGFLWMGMCLGMATDSFPKALREKGVEVLYGYSQSVTFGAETLYSRSFWEEMTAGADVASAIAHMKKEWGEWDFSPKIADYYSFSSQYDTISAARSHYAAFPIVVSDVDEHPGQRYYSSNYGADCLQTVASTYKLTDPGLEDTTGVILPVEDMVAPIVEDHDLSSVTLLDLAGFEYSMDGENWQQSNVFGNLDSGTEYTFYQRRRATLTEPAGPVSEATAVTTAIPGASTYAYFILLQLYIEAFGELDSNGFYDIHIQAEKVYYSLTSVPDAIQISLLVDNTTYSYEAGRHGDVYMTCLTVDMDSQYITGEVIVAQYAYNALMRSATDTVIIDRTTLTPTSQFDCTKGTSWCPAGALTSIFNEMLHQICYLTDLFTMESLQFGLKNLGFFAYSSAGGEAVCDVPSGYHCGETELRDQREAGCVIPGSTGHLYCECGLKLEEAEEIPSAGGHSYGSKWNKDETHHWHTCVECDAIGDRGEHIPREDDPTACRICSRATGDIDGNDAVTQDDAVYLLLHTMFGEAFYPLNGTSADIDRNGSVNQEDAVYLLLHTMFGEAFYPLNAPVAQANIKE